MASSARARKLTFPSVGVIKGSRVWRNRETGVEISRRIDADAGVDSYYVWVPTQDGRVSIATRSSFADAFVVAQGRAMNWRNMIAEAYMEAMGDDNARWNADRAAAREAVKVGDKFRDPNLLGSPCVVTEVSEDGQRFSARWMPGGSITWYPLTMVSRWQRA